MCRAGLTIEICSQLAFVAISRPTETRWWYDWLRMVFTRCASSELQFGALREYRPGSRMNLAHSQEFHLFCEQEQLQKHPTLDKNHTVYTAPLIWCPLKGGGMRKARDSVAESPDLWVSTHQIRRVRKAARSLTSQRSAETLCAKVKCANREVSEGKADL